MPRAAACAITCSITFTLAASFAHSSSVVILTLRDICNADPHNNFAHFNVIAAYVRRNVPRALRKGGDIRTFERHCQL
jgi:hypothetical protein